MQQLAPILGSSALAAQRERLKLHIDRLATEIGPRNLYHYSSLCRAAEYIEKALCGAGYVPTRQTFEANGKTFTNIVAEKHGTDVTGGTFVVGAHYDTHKDSPGANDNGSGIAALLELARALSGQTFPKSLRFVAFTNEESPFTRTRHMGSYVYAQACRARADKLTGMLCLETLGCYSEEPGSQWGSLGGLLLPGRGNFLALVGNLSSKALLQLCSDGLRDEARVRFRSLRLPGQLPGVRSSDHWSFWKSGYEGVMATDTAPLRYKHYHRATDTPDKIDFEWLERVVDGLQGVLRRAVDKP